MANKKFVVSAKSVQGTVFDVYQVPRLTDINSNEIKIRIIKQKDRVLVHITAPDTETVKKAAKEILGSEEGAIIEWCG